MLKQASVAQLHHGEISRKDGYIVVAARFYPRAADTALKRSEQEPIGYRYKAAPGNREGREPHGR